MNRERVNKSNESKFSFIEIHNLCEVQMYTDKNV